MWMLRAHWSPVTTDRPAPTILCDMPTTTDNLYLSLFHCVAADWRTAARHAEAPSVTANVFCSFHSSSTWMKAAGGRWPKPRTPPPPTHTLTHTIHLWLNNNNNNSNVVFGWIFQRAASFYCSNEHMKGLWRDLVASVCFSPPQQQVPVGDGSPVPG